jgi:hypothetical protein
MADWDITKSGAGLSRLIPERNYQGLNTQSDQLRVWLPDPAKTALEELAERAETSMTVYLIEYFVSYLYGQYELQRMREARMGLYEPKTTKYSLMGVREPELPDLGKNIYALKIFVPAKMKADLQKLAERAQVTLGEYVRSLVCANLFGQEYGVRSTFEIAIAQERAASEWEKSAAEGADDDRW